MQALVLISPDFSKPFTVQYDTSNIGLGAVLTKNTEGEEHVFAFASRLLTGTKKSNSDSEKECLVVVWAVEKWRKYQEGRQFKCHNLPHHFVLVISIPKAAFSSDSLDHKTAGLPFHCNVSKRTIQRCL